MLSFSYWCDYEDSTTCLIVIVKRDRDYFISVIRAVKNATKFKNFYKISFIYEQ